MNPISQFMPHQFGHTFPNLSLFHQRASHQHELLGSATSGILAQSSLTAANMIANAGPFHQSHIQNPFSIQLSPQSSQCGNHHLVAGSTSAVDFAVASSSAVGHHQYQQPTIAALAHNVISSSSSSSSPVSGGARSGRGRGSRRKDNSLAANRSNQTGGMGQTKAAIGKPKRNRTIFSSEQLKYLEHEFRNQMYMVGEDRGHLAKSLSLSESQVKVWFQNRRIKERKLQEQARLAHKDVL